MNKNLSQKTIRWQGSLTREGYELLEQKAGSVVVSPTKVGYVIISTDEKGLERKFNVKKRKRNKPAVVLCSSLEQLRELATLNPEIDSLYQLHWDSNILLGCILPWKDDALRHIPNDGCRRLMMDGRNTSCFVIQFGTPTAQIVSQLWNERRKLVFASSANPSGQGNRGVLAGVGARIEDEADLIIEADDYVCSIQPNETEGHRYEQGVMVSMVDNRGNLVPMQNSQRGISPSPILIRKGLDLDKIMQNLSSIFHSWDYRHGAYY